MRAWADLRVLFRASAGPRRGFGHLVRCRSLARALGVRPLVALRGETAAVDAALRLGCDVVMGEPKPLLSSLRPHLLVVDDPIAAQARRWIDEARRWGTAVATVHDLGIGCLDGDLVIDGSVAPAGAFRRPGRRVLKGTDFAVLDPDIVTHRAAVADPNRVLIALGGGPRLALARRIARQIVAEQPDADIRVATGLVADPPRAEGGSIAGRITWIGARDGLATELTRSAVAVVGGGVLLYEACALGVAAVGVPVVPSQRPTVAAFVARGAARGSASRPSPTRVASEAVRLLRDDGLRKRVAAKGLRLVDGRGARRAAAAVTALVKEHA